MIDKIGSTLVNDKIKSVYSFNDYSIQDLLSKFFEQINNVTDLVNQNEEKINIQNFKLEEFINYMKNEGIPPIVIETLTTMYNDGRLTELFNSLANNVIDKVEEFKSQINSQLEHIEYQIKNKKELDIAIEKIKNKKGGTITLLNDIELIETTTEVKNIIYDLCDLYYFNLNLNGYTLIIDDTNFDNVFDIFAFTNCKNINVKKANVKGKNDRFPFIRENNKYVSMGACFIGLYENNENIKIEEVYGENINSICLCKRKTNVTDLTLNKTKNIELNNISGTSIVYPFNFRFNGDNVKGRNLKFDKVHRGYFSYGVKNHDIEIEVSNFDASGCLLNAYEGKGLENIKVKLVSKNNSNILAPFASKSLQLKFGDKQSAIFKNIDITLDVENLYNKVDNIFDIAFDGVGVGTEGHLIDGLKIKGKINGCVNGAFSVTSYNLGSYLNTTFKNVELKDIEILKQGANSSFILEPLEGYCLLENIRIYGDNKRFYISKNDNKECDIIIKNCNCGQITQNNFNNKAIYEDCNFSDDYNFNFNNKILRNVIINGKLYNIDKLNTMLDITNLPTKWWNQFPSIILNKEINNLGNLSTYSFEIELDTNIIQLGSRYTQPNIFNFYITYQNSAYDRVGIITGKLLLKTEKQTMTTLTELYVIDKKFTGLKSAITCDVTLTVSDGKIQVTLTTSGGSALNNIGFTLTT